MATIAIWRINPFIGGTEVSLIELARFLSLSGHCVWIYGSADGIGPLATEMGVGISPESEFITRQHDVLLWYDDWNKHQHTIDPAIVKHMMKIPHRYGVFGGFAPWLISPVFTKAIAKTQEIADWLTTQGVETAKISQFPIDLSYWRRDSYWQRKVPVVGYVGRTEGKNLKQLVSLAKKAGHNRVKLVVNDRVDTEGISKFGCEIVRNPTLVRQHYFEMDIFMMTSLIEGIPRVIMEAMAMSLPIVVFGIGGIPFLNPTYHFHPEDTDNLVKTLKELVLDCGKREEVGGINRKRIEEYDGQIRDSLKSWFDGLK